MDKIHLNWLVDKQAMLRALKEKLEEVGAKKVLLKTDYCALGQAVTPKNKEQAPFEVGHSTGTRVGRV